MTRRYILGLLGTVFLIALYSLLKTFVIRTGACQPEPVHTLVDVSPRPSLTVLTYNISGHDALVDAQHIAKIAAVINEIHPDLVGLQEVHRGTWQSRFRDQLQELEAATHMHGWFGSAYRPFGGGEFGNAILTRGDIVSATVDELPSVGEPRVVVESTVRIDGATIDFYVTHLVTWGRIESNARAEQLQCLARMLRASRYPYIVAGDFNAPPASTEVQAFQREHVAQLCGANIGITHPLMKERIDYVWADYGWTVATARVVPMGPSDHYPVVTVLRWNR